MTQSSPSPLCPSVFLYSSGIGFSLFLAIFSCPRTLWFRLLLLQNTPANFHFFFIVAPAKRFRLLLGTLDRWRVFKRRTSKGRGVGRLLRDSNPVWRVHFHKQVERSRWVAVLFEKELGSFQTALSFSVYNLPASNKSVHKPFFLLSKACPSSLEHALVMMWDSKIRAAESRILTVQAKSLQAQNIYCVK